MSDIDRETLTIEDLQKAGLDTSGYEYKDTEYWLPARDAAKLIGWLNGCTVDTKYLSNPAKRGDILYRRVGAIRLYAFSSLRKYTVKAHGRPAGRGHTAETKKLISDKNRASWAKRHSCQETLV